MIYREATAKHQQSRWESTKQKVLDQVAKRCAFLENGVSGKSGKALLRKLVELIPKGYHAVFDYGVERREGELWPCCTISAEAEERFRRSWGEAAIITDLPMAQLSDADIVEGCVTWRRSRTTGSR